MNSTRDFSSNQEKEIAKVLGGNITPNSGGTKFSGGDVKIRNDFLIEAKTPTTAKESFSIKKDWIAKVRQQAFEQGCLEAVLAFTFAPNGQNYYIISENLMKELVDYFEELGGF